MDAQQVQYGCGTCAPPSWRNFDASPTLRLQRLPGVGRLLRGVGPTFPKTAEYGDIVRGLPVAPGSCRALYCSHVLEHLSLEDCRRALRHSYESLAKGGVFRLVLPDLELLARDYLASSDPDASIIFMEQTILGKKSRPRGGMALLRGWIGNSTHLWMWDYKSLEHELRQAGFSTIRRATFGDSTEACFADVEEPGRWDGALGIECVK